MIIIRCPKCNATLEIYKDLDSIRCPRCKNIITRKR